MSSNIVVTVSVIIASCVGAIELIKWYVAPSVKISATVQSSEYMLQPSIRSLIDSKPLDILEVTNRLGNIGYVKDLGYTPGQLTFVAQIIDQQRSDLIKEIDDDYRTFSIYKLENTGDKAALNVALVNSRSGVASVQGRDAPQVVSDKDAIVIGELPPRSTTLVHFWGNSFYLRDEGEFIKHSDGLVDVEPYVMLGGFYRHLDKYLFLYVLSVGLLIAFYFSVVVNNQSTQGTQTVTPQSVNKRRRRRRKKTPRLPSPVDE